jgi:hypothetical protein
VVQGNVYRHISFSATGAARMTNAAWAVTTSKTRAKIHLTFVGHDFFEGS